MTPKKQTDVAVLEGEEAPPATLATTFASLAKVGTNPPTGATLVPGGETASGDVWYNIVALHPLDTAPVNSKIVVVIAEGIVKAVLAGPNGVSVLPTDDPASKLPEGAMIQKTKPGRFEAIQLNPVYDVPPLVTATAGEAISGFVPHFHRAT